MPNLKTSGFQHQTDYRQSHALDPAYALWWEMGTGKSRAALDTAMALYDAGAINAMLLLAPSLLHRNFVEREVPKHLDDGFLEDVSTFAWNTARSKTKTFQNAAADFLKPSPKFKILGLSYDGLMTEDGRALAKSFLTSTRSLYVLDESGRIKDIKADRSVRVLGSAPFAPFRRIMTGTPVSNAPWDVYTQIKFLDKDFWKPHGLDSPEAMKAAFGEWEKTAKRVPPAMMNRNRSLQVYYAKENIPSELRTQFVDKGNGTVLQMIPKLKSDMDGRPRYKNLIQLRDILAPIRSRVLKSDVLDLPPKLYSRLDFDLSPAQRRCYDQLQKMGFALVGDRQCSASLALTVLLRLQQIACGYLVTDIEDGEEDPVVVPMVPNPRIDLLKEVIDGVNHQGIIWARFSQDITAIIEALRKAGKTCVRYDGRISEDECFANEEAFHRGDAQWFVSNQAKGGEGLTLNEAKTMIYYSNSFKLTERLQSEDRAHRFGQTSSVNVIDLFARGTMEERLINNLIGKFDVASIVVGDGLRDWIQPVGRLL
jgi:hypothetical protein